MGLPAASERRGRAAAGPEGVNRSSARDAGRRLASGGSGMPSMPSLTPRRVRRSRRSGEIAGGFAGVLIPEQLYESRRRWVNSARRAGDIRMRPDQNYRMMIIPRIRSSVFGPIPATSTSPSTLANGPFSSRWATIRAARAGPTPGSASNAAISARLMSMRPAVSTPAPGPAEALPCRLDVPDPPTPEPLNDEFPAPPTPPKEGEPNPPGTRPSGGRPATSSRPGTWICCPSPRVEARLTWSRAASFENPPAPRSASATRAPSGRSTTPGRDTAPLTYTWRMTSVGAGAGVTVGGGSIRTAATRGSRTRDAKPPRIAKFSRIKAACSRHRELARMSPSIWLPGAEIGCGRHSRDR